MEKTWPVSKKSKDDDVKPEVCQLTGSASDDQILKNDDDVLIIGEEKKDPDDDIIIIEEEISVIGDEISTNDRDHVKQKQTKV